MLHKSLNYMKILENNHKPKLPEFPKEVECKDCHSKLEIERSDIVSEGRREQREMWIEYGYYCPCCKNFNVTNYQL